MSALVDWTAVGEILVESLVAGLVIAGVFSVGARLVAVTADRRESRAGTAVPTAAAALCFLVVAVAIGYGIYFTIDK